MSSTLASRDLVAVTAAAASTTSAMSMAPVWHPPAARHTEPEREGRAWHDLVMRVTELQVYPVKSLGGVSVGTSVVEPWGLAGDRRWGLVDDGGEMVTAREAHQLLALRAEPVDDERIRLVDREGASILVDPPLGLGPVPISLSRQGFAAPADEWRTTMTSGVMASRFFTVSRRLSPFETLEPRA